MFLRRQGFRPSAADPGTAFRWSGWVSWNEDVHSGACGWLRFAELTTTNGQRIWPGSSDTVVHCLSNEVAEVVDILLVSETSPSMAATLSVIFSINHFQYQYCCWVQHHPAAMTPWNTDPCDLLTAFTVSSERYFLLQIMCLSRWRRMSGHVPSNSTCITSWIKHCVILKCGKSIKVLHELIPYSLDQFRLAAWDKVPSVSQRSMCSTSFQRRKWHSLKKWIISSALQLHVRHLRDAKLTPLLEATNLVCCWCISYNNNKGSSFNANSWQCNATC